MLLTLYISFISAILFRQESTYIKVDDTKGKNSDELVNLDSNKINATNFILKLISEDGSPGDDFVLYLGNNRFLATSDNKLKSVEIQEESQKSGGKVISLDGKMYKKVAYKVDVIDGGNVTIKHKDSKRCIIKEKGNLISMGDCSTSAALWKMEDATGSASTYPELTVVLEKNSNDKNGKKNKSTLIAVSGTNPRDIAWFEISVEKGEGITAIKEKISPDDKVNTSDPINNFAQNYFSVKEHPPTHDQAIQPAWTHPPNHDQAIQPAWTAQQPYQQPAQQPAWTHPLTHDQAIQQSYQGQQPAQQAAWTHPPNHDQAIQPAWTAQQPYQQPAQQPAWTHPLTHDQAIQQSYQGQQPAPQAAGTHPLTHDQAIQPAWTHPPNHDQAIQPAWTHPLTHDQAIQQPYQQPAPQAAWTHPPNHDQAIQPAWTAQQPYQQPAQQPYQQPAQQPYQQPALQPAGTAQQAAWTGQQTAGAPPPAYPQGTLSPYSAPPPAYPQGTMAPYSAPPPAYPQGTLSSYSAPPPAYSQGTMAQYSAPPPAYPQGTMAQYSAPPPAYSQGTMAQYSAPPPAYSQGTMAPYSAPPPAYSQGTLSSYSAPPPAYSQGTLSPYSAPPPAYSQGTMAQYSAPPPAYSQGTMAQYSAPQTDNKLTASDYEKISQIVENLIDVRPRQNPYISEELPFISGNYGHINFPFYKSQQYANEQGNSSSFIPKRNTANIFKNSLLKNLLLKSNSFSNLFPDKKAENEAFVESLQSSLRGEASEE
ncbi:hypothetical protein GINT2_002178 [Glugoides intestinalis]